MKQTRPALAVFLALALLIGCGGTPDFVSSAAVAPNGKTYVAGKFNEAAVQKWSVHAGSQPAASIWAGGHPISLALSPDARTVATGAIYAMGAKREGFKMIETLTSVSNNPQIWDAETGLPIHTLKEGSFVHCLRFSPDGKTLAAIDRLNKNRAILWDVETGAMISTLKIRGKEAKAMSLAFSPDGKIAGAWEGYIKIWSGPTDEAPKTLMTRHPIHMLAFSPDGKRIAGYSEGVNVQLWDVEKSAHLRALEGGAYAVNALAFSPDSKTLAAAESGIGEKIAWRDRYSVEGNAYKIAKGRLRKHAARLWDVETGKLVKTFRSGTGVLAAAFSEDGKALLGIDSKRKVRSWDLDKR